MAASSQNGSEVQMASPQWQHLEDPMEDARAKTPKTTKTRRNEKRGLQKAPKVPHNSHTMSKKEGRGKRNRTPNRLTQNQREKWEKERRTRQERGKHNALLIRKKRRLLISSTDNEEGPNVESNTNVFPSLRLSLYPRVL